MVLEFLALIQLLTLSRKESSNLTSGELQLFVVIAIVVLMYVESRRQRPILLIGDSGHCQTLLKREDVVIMKVFEDHSRANICHPLVFCPAITAVIPVWHRVTCTPISHQFNQRVKELICSTVKARIGSPGKDMVSCMSCTLRCAFI